LDHEPIQPRPIAASIFPSRISSNSESKQPATILNLLVMDVNVISPQDRDLVSNKDT
jgi:hypothetical protein